MKKLKDFIEDSTVRMYMAYWIEGKELVKAGFSTDTEVAEDAPKWLFALCDVACRLYNLEVGETMFVQMNRDNPNEKGVVVRTH